MPSSQSPGIADNPPTPGQAAARGNQSRAEQAFNTTFASTAPPWWESLTPSERADFVRQWNARYGTSHAVGSRRALAEGIFKDPRIKSDAYVGPIIQSVQNVKAPYGQAQVFGKKLPVPAGTAKTPVGQVSKASELAPGSNPYLRLITAAAAQYGVPWQVLWGLVRGESNFQVINSRRNSDGSYDRGIAQINSKAHGEISDALANDPTFAIGFAARKLREGFDQYQDWSLSVLSYHRPKAAQTIRDTGRSEPGRASADMAYIAKAFKGLEQLGFTFDDVAIDASSGAQQLEGGGAAYQAKFALPDPVAVREKVVGFFQQRLFRDPTEQEIQAGISMVNGLVGQANSEDQARTVASGGGAAGLAFTGADDGLDAVHAPLASLQKTGEFGEDRPGHKHAGNDYAAKHGESVFNAVEGVVTFAGERGTYGNLIVVKGKDGREYRYAHLSAIGVNEGDGITAGTVIGKVGSTGHSTGPHLHFEVREGGKAVDPDAILEHAAQSVDPMAASAAPQSYDDDAQLRQSIKDMPEYQALYAKRPTGVSEDEYAQQFAGTAQGLLGAQHNNEAIRSGLRAGDVAVTAGQIAGDPSSAKNPTFRAGLFSAAELMNRLT